VGSGGDQCHSLADGAGVSIEFEKPEPVERRRRPGPMFALLTALTLAGSAGFWPGCAAARRSWNPGRDPNTLSGAIFLHYLATVPVVSVDEGMRAVLLLSDDGARFPTYDRRKEELMRRGAVRASWGLNADAVLDKGTLAHMLRVVCDLPLGLNETFLSPVQLGDRRYALRSCIHEGLLPYGLAQEPVKGGELLSALTAAERYLAN